MRYGRRSSGFARLGDLGAEGLGLPARRGRELSLAVAWRRAAGPTLCSLARPIGLRRGTFELELLPTAGEEGRRALEATAPELLEALGEVLPRRPVGRILLRPAPSRTGQRS